MTEEQLPVVFSTNPKGVVFDARRDRALTVVFQGNPTADDLRLLDELVKSRAPKPKNIFSRLEGKPSAEVRLRGGRGAHKGD